MAEPRVLMQFSYTRAVHEMYSRGLAKNLSENFSGLGQPLAACG